MPASAIYRWRMGLAEIPGVDNNVFIGNSSPLVSKHKFITANTATPYISAYTDLSKGPVVLEIPAASEKASLYGQVVDAWQSTIAGVGPSGLDKGQGGKYLFIPPAYKEAIPDGYIPIKSTSFRIALAFRSVRGKSATEADAYTYAQTMKMYYLSEMPVPTTTPFIDGFQYSLFTLPFYDIRALQDIYNIVSIEPVREQDKVMMGMLATLGIERGKPFTPAENLKAAMGRGVIDAYHYIHDRVLKVHAENMYWPDRNWSFAMVPDDKSGFDFITDNAVEIDRRSAAWQFFTFYPKLLTEQPATVYLAPMADSQGRSLEAGKSYRLTIPKDIPVKQFWSLTVYDEATWGFLDNPLGRSGLDSYNKDKLKENSDGSIDLFFGPKAPKDMESNWIPTMDKKPYLWLRLYGADTAFWDKSFKMPDVERID